MEQIKTNVSTTFETITEKVYINEEGKEDLIIRKEHKMLKDNALSSGIKYVIIDKNRERINESKELVITEAEALFIFEVLKELITNRG